MLLPLYMFAAVFQFGESLVAQAPIPGISAPVLGSATIQFISTNHDFGRVVEGRIVQTEFVFMNTGDAPLEIRDVRPDCECTVSTNWDRRIDSGKRGVIPVQFKSAGFLGPLSKSVTVFCNDPARSNVVLRTSALVWKPINVTPGAVYFSLTSESQTNQTRVAKITNHDQEEQFLVLSQPTSDQRLFKPTIKTNKPGQEYELEIGLVPPLIGSNITGKITIPTSSPKIPEIAVGVVVVFQSPVSALPPQLVIPAALDARHEFSVYIRNNENTAIMVSDASLNLTNVQIQLNEFQKGRLFRVLVNFPVGYQLPPEQQGELTVKTSHPRVPLLKIPIVAKVPSPPPPPSASQETAAD